MSESEKPAALTAEIVRLIIRDEVTTLINAHQLNCPFAHDGYPDRIRKIELSFAKLVGLMAGSAVAGNLIGEQLSKLF
jgi:hypothetical protein